jgi:phosphate uptake regulator
VYTLLTVSVPNFFSLNIIHKKKREEKKKKRKRGKKLYAEVEEKVLRLSYPDHPLAFSQPVSSCFSSIFFFILYSQFILSHTLIVSQFVSQVESLYQRFFYACLKILISGFIFVEMKKKEKHIEKYR